MFFFIKNNCVHFLLEKLKQHDKLINQRREASNRIALIISFSPSREKQNIIAKQPTSRLLKRNRVAGKTNEVYSNNNHNNNEYTSCESVIRDNKISIFIMGRRGGAALRWPTRRSADTRDIIIIRTASSVTNATKAVRLQSPVPVPGRGCGIITVEPITDEKGIVV